MLKKLRIGPKLLLAPGLVLVLLIATAAAGYYGMVRQNASMENLVQVRAERLKACLLYTSPSPRDGLLSRMPSSA